MFIENNQSLILEVEFHRRIKIALQTCQSLKPLELPAHSQIIKKNKKSTKNYWKDKM